LAQAYVLSVENHNPFVFRAFSSMGQLAYVLAASHSGSTLLSMVAGAHPEACTVGELKANFLGNPERYRCSCRELIMECPFWKKVTAAMAAKGIEYDPTRARTSIASIPYPYVKRLLGPLHRGPFLEGIRDAALSLHPGWHRDLKVIQERNAALVNTLQELSGAKVIIDSSKVGLRLKYLLRNPGLDIKIIRMIRDGRAVALTYMDTDSFADATDPSLRASGRDVGLPGLCKKMAAGLPMESAAREWRRSNEEAECLLAGLDKSQWIEVRYEDLCTETEATLRRIYEFLGLDPAKMERNFRSKEHHVVGNGMRLDTTSEIWLDERWKQHLTKEDLLTFDSIAGDLNRRYGYN
jgi:hypothetical protein